MTCIKHHFLTLIFLIFQPAHVGYKQSPKQLVVSCAYTTCKFNEYYLHVIQYKVRPRTTRTLHVHVHDRKMTFYSTSMVDSVMGNYEELHVNLYTVHFSLFNSSADYISTST